MSKKGIGNDEKKSIKEFDEYFKLRQEDEWKEIEELYAHIKQAYRTKFKDDEMKIKIEKINLERNIGKYQGVLRKSNVTLSVGIVGIMLQLVVPEFLKAIHIDKPAINVAFMIIILIWIIYTMAKDADKERPKDLMKHIALKVLEDMEKEINGNRVIQEKEADREKTIEQIKQYIDSANTIKNTVLPVMAEIAATSIVKKGVISNLIRKMRKG